MTQPSFHAVADHALLVGFGDRISDETHAAVLALDHVFGQSQTPGVLETVPALVNLLIDFDPMVTDHQRIKAAVSSCLNHPKAEVKQPNTHVVPICYDDEFSVDLASIAKAKGISVEAALNAHLRGEFHVMMYGFSPGYAYMGGVPDMIQVPRKPSALRDVAAGSVIIAGTQCLITTLKMPTGWSIIGRSPIQVFTHDPTRPFLFDVGDHVRFERIDRDTYHQKVRHGAG